MRPVLAAINPQMMGPFWTNGIATLYQADARQIPIPDQSVHCVVTSPPYFGLRVYRSDSDAMIGLEETVPGWIDSMLEVMAEVGRVLRDDGILWVNLGDSYAGSGKDGGTASKKQVSNSGSLTMAHLPIYKESASGQLLMIPARFALAMQDAGWILRSDVIWAKKSPMPESVAGTRWERCRVKVAGNTNIDNGKNADHQDRRKVGFNDRWDSPEENSAQYTDCPGCPKCADTDGLILRSGSWRCTSSHEHIFQFVKGMGYYSDGEAVKTESNANRRNVWSDISPEPYGGEHYATFPSDLPRLCIQASTSEAGVCADCGSQWARVVERGETTGQGIIATGIGHVTGLGHDRVAMRELSRAGDVQITTTNWQPTCTCNADKVPATVLDCFAGTGTTLLAAMRLGRRSVGVDLSPDYLGQAVKRLGKQSLPMLI